MKALLRRLLPAVFAVWLVVTALSQHPDRSFDRVRQVDRTGTGLLIPNWRFFAPNPAVHDQHFLYRLANEDRSDHTPWMSVYEAEPRRWWHAFWFPARRMEKSIFDAASTILNNQAASVPTEKEAVESAKRLVTSFVRARVTPREGYPYFQVLLVRYSGYDHSENPLYDMVFDYEPVEIP
ncbi:DUF5819 family protein [Actinomyces wuliandei]|uniref:DUF5819 family protein n=1 Tax=Actinomyces wuliandei TaxID=2057743 RepID=UPI001118A5D5|nr:DUF5819 family protein [Actinomyces wuliandei]